jgi:hypothetical protein
MMPWTTDDNRRPRSVKSIQLAKCIRWRYLIAQAVSQRSAVSNMSHLLRLPQCQVLVLVGELINARWRQLENGKCEGFETWLHMTYDVCVRVQIFDLFAGCSKQDLVISLLSAIQFQEILRGKWCLRSHSLCLSSRSGFQGWMRPVFGGRSIWF